MVILNKADSHPPAHAPVAPAPPSALTTLPSTPALAPSAPAVDASSLTALRADLERTKGLLASALKANGDLVALVAKRRAADAAPPPPPVATSQTREELAAEIAKLKSAHASEIALREAEHDIAISKMKADHASSLGFRQTEAKFTAQQAPAITEKIAPKKPSALAPVAIVVALLAGTAGVVVYLRSSDAKPTPERSAAASSGAKDPSDDTTPPKEDPSATADLKTQQALTSLQTLSRMLKMDAVIHDLPPPEALSDYMRKNGSSKGGDPAMDPWGIPYRMDLPPQRAVRSAGPDKAFDTADDVIVPIDGIVSH